MATRRSLLLATICFAGLPGLLTACMPGGDLQPLADYHPQGYRLGSGDAVRLITYGEDQLTGEFRVSDQGQLALPLLGNVDAAGMTTQELGERVAAALRSKNIIRDPSVSVEVVAYRPIFVLGEVAKPGQYPYQPGMTMLTAVAVAGGFTYRGVQGYASVVRSQGNHVETGRILPDAFVAPGDVIKILERNF